MNLHIIPYKRLGHADTNSQLLILYFSMGREGFPGGTSGKEPTCQYRSHKGRQFDLWVRKIPWRRAWQPTPVFLPEGSHGGGGWQATVHGVTKSHTLLKRLSRHWRYQDDIPAWGLGLPASRSPRSQGRDHDSAQGSGSVAARWGACVSSSLSGSPCSPVPCLAAPLEPTLKNGCNSKS